MSVLSEKIILLTLIQKSINETQYKTNKNYLIIFLILQRN